MENNLENPTSFIFPFIGSVVGDYDLFHYHPYVFKPEGIELQKEEIVIMISKWTTDRYRLRKWDIVNFYLPICNKSLIATRGKVEHIEWNHDLNVEFCHLTLLNEPVKTYDLFLKIENHHANIQIQSQYTFDELVINAIKNCYLIKKAIQIYLKHFITYFSHLTTYTFQDYTFIKSFFLQDSLLRTGLHVAKLETLYFYLKEQRHVYADLVDFIDPIKVMEWIDPELNADVLNLAFRSVTHIPYIDAIKQLEEPSYISYNVIMMLLTKSANEYFAKPKLIPVQ